MTVQIPLGLSLKDSASFENYVSGNNQAAVASARSCAVDSNEPVVYLWGGDGTGKSHLLQAAALLVSERNQSASYLPISQMRDYPVDVLDGLETMDIVCIDDIDAAAGNPAWEQALFSLFNRVRDNGGKLLITAKASPNDIGVSLPDLVSRLSWGPVYHLLPLSDEDKIQALQLRARMRGINFPAESARYLIRHQPRDMGNLFSILDQLDEASLVAQRKITIPFIKEVLNVV